MSFTESLKEQTKTLQSGWSSPQEQDSTAPATISVPVSIRTPLGNVRIYLNFDGGHATSMEGILNLLKSLHEEGVPINFWKEKSSSGWGDGGNDSGGYQGNRNYRRRY